MRPCKRTSPACGGGGSPDEPDDGKYRRSVFIGALTLGFGLGVALFFSTGAPLPCKVCYPAAWLSLVLFALRDKACVPVAGALLLSAAGDAAGAVHDFLLQMFLFALAHVAYIRYFLPSAEFSRRRIAAAAVVGAGLLLFLFAGIVPRVASSVERTGVALYGTVIAAMLLSVLFYRGRYAPGFRRRGAALRLLRRDDRMEQIRGTAPRRHPPHHVHLLRRTVPLRPAGPRGKQPQSGGGQAVNDTSSRNLRTPEIPPSKFPNPRFFAYLCRIKIRHDMLLSNLTAISPSTDATAR